jgi:regulator of protease activity HflC (stomatin/prohibitin superfamily)
MREKPAFSLPGGAMLLVVLVAIAGTLFVLMSSAQMQVTAGVVLAMFALGVEVICLKGLLIVNPNEGQVLQLFGTYVGTLRDQGWRWVNPFTTKRRISLRVRNFETSKLKVNDLDGNPIEIAAVVVWQVVDTAEAVFQVDSYENFVQVQSESALRTMATSYAYDSHVAGQMSLRSHIQETAAELQKEIQDRLAKAGVSIVQMALDQLSERKVVELDPERRAAMVSNLLVVLCGERSPQPVVNAGSLYS